MRTLFAAAAIAVALATSPALAGDPPAPAQSGPNNSAIKSPDTNIASVPVKGANSFTRGEAISRLKAKGYTNVVHLQKDNSGVWRGTAKKDGRAGRVSVDFEGNVIGS